MNTTDEIKNDAATQPASAKDKKQASMILRIVHWIVTIIGIMIILWGIWKAVQLFLDYSTKEECDDAQVEQYMTPVNLRATGYISRICFQEHQYVHKGDTLMILDQREYLIRVKEAEAAVKDAMAGGDVLGATIERTSQSASVIDNTIEELQVRLQQLEKDRQRYRNLLEKKAVTQYQLDQIEVEYKALTQKLNAAQQQRKAAGTGVSEVRHRTASIEAARQRTEAALEQAQLNLSYTVVIAPCDGQVGRRTIEEGQYITAGTTITYIIPDTPKWIICNFKEKQLEQVKVGQKCEITIDAMKGKTFSGHVTSIAGATGNKFSLVPTDNSAGNFVKIQQRVPVRIDFDNISKEDNRRLAAGMMAVVKAEK